MEEFGLLLKFLKNLSTALDAVQFLATGFAYLEELFFLVYTQESATKEIGGDAGGAAPCERVKYPRPGLSGRQDNAG